MYASTALEPDEAAAARGVATELERRPDLPRVPLMTRRRERSAPYPRRGFLAVVPGGPTRRRLGRTVPSSAYLIALLLVVPFASELGPSSGAAHSGWAPTPSAVVARAALPAIRPSETSLAYTPPGPIQHVFLIMMENEGVDQIYGTEPFETRLADSYAWGGDALSNGGVGYYAVCHPSAPNYLAITSGSSLQCGSDGYTNHSGRNNLFNVLDGAGASWVAYAESMPVACDSQNVGEYAVRHNPAPYYGDLGGQAVGAPCEMNDRPIANLTLDYPYNATPPAFTYIAPNLLNDGHDSSAAVADGFLGGFVSRLVNTSWFGSTAILIAYDESFGASPNSGYDGLSGGPVYMVSVSNYSKGIGPVELSNSSHYDLLSTIEWLLGVPGTGSGNDSTSAFPAIHGLFRFPVAVTANASPTSGSAPLTVHLDANASGGIGPYGFLWQLGNGLSRSSASANYSYGVPGNYTASVRATDSSGSSATSNVTIHVLPSTGPLSAAVVASRTEGAAPLTVNLSIGELLGGPPPYTENWSFGDGHVGSGSSVRHTFESVGQFTVLLEVADGLGATTNASALIDVYPPLRVGIDLLSAPELLLGATIRAGAILSGGPSSGLDLAWSIDGATVATGTSLNYTPTSAGTVVVGLSANDSMGDSATAHVNVSVTMRSSTCPCVTTRPGVDPVLLLGAGLGLLAAVLVAAAVVRRRRSPPR